MSASPFAALRPFYVYAKGSSLFFVTESGKLYTAKASQAGGRKVEEAWPRPQQPVLALLLDANSSQVFAFGKDSFFEVRDVMQPSPCEDITGGLPGVEEPLRTVMRCAEILKKWRQSVKEALLISDN